MIPARKRVTIGRRGELVVRVIITKASPLGKADVSRLTVNLPS